MMIKPQQIASIRQAVYASSMAVLTIPLVTIAAEAQSASASTETFAGFACCTDGTPELTQADGLIDASSSAYAEGDSFGLSSFGDSDARASLETGLIGVKASSYYFGQASAHASWTDILSFDIAGADSSTITPISFRVHWHGNVTSGFSPYDGRGSSQYQFVVHQYEGYTYRGSAILYIDARSANGEEQTRSVQTTGDWTSVGHVGADSSSQYFDFKYGLVGKNPTLRVGSDFTANSFLSANADFFNTAGLNMFVPKGVTYTSASGVFLANAPLISLPTVGVPEPSTWALMILGFGAIGSAMRRRRSVRANVRFACS